ncbi:MAG: aspartate/glutamate racemase family protein [Thiofilum sp.]|uniref:aspartate/glutamate racemase family protein n=1 Tax=Thiofilum sp. TaxID=2212733 RepID=UPI002600A895|nr:aspartate/glutamate racemase family protein [Thiofilum sp.]MBK8454037.1 aspartate/glutamate racemase family protein [Thiofilum sp.]
MKIVLINPNTTSSMTTKAAQTARSVAAAGTVIVERTPSMGPVSIEGYYDEVFSIPGLIAEMQAEPDADGFIIACFDDTGLDAARCITAAPVVGIGEAAFHFAALLGAEFAVVTTLSRSIPALKHNLLKYGLAHKCAKVRAAEVPVLELEKEGSEACGKISSVIEQCIKADGAEVIVLGCAGMTDLATQLSMQHGVPVVDGVVSAVKLIEGLVSVGLKTSKIGGYAKPLAKPYLGAMEGFAPHDKL